MKYKIVVVRVSNIGLMAFLHHFITHFEHSTTAEGINYFAKNTHPNELKSGVPDFKNPAPRVFPQTCGRTGVCQ